MKQLLGRGGPLGAFYEFPALFRLAIISACAETTWATLLVVLEYYFKDELLKGESNQFIASKVALAFLAFTGAETLFKYPMGTLADRLGPRRFVLLALSIGAGTPILMTVFGSLLRHSHYGWVPFIPLRALDGFAAAALWPAMSALMTRAVPLESRATAMSVFNYAYILGLGLGPAVGLGLGFALGSNLYVFPAMAVIMGVGLVLALRFIPHTQHEAGSGESLAEERALLKGRPLLVRMMALYAVSQIGVGLLAPTLPLYLGSQFHIEQADLFKLLPIPALLILAVALPLGRLPDTLGRAKSVWISYALAVAGMLGIAGSSLFHPTHGLFHPSLAIFGAGLMLMIVSYILGTPAWLGLTSAQVDETKQAQALSLMQAAQGVGVVIAYLTVASAGHFLTSVAKVRAKIHHAPTFKAVDTVPLSVWFWLSLVVFTLCFIGTLVFVKEPAPLPNSSLEKERLDSSVV